MADFLIGVAYLVVLLFVILLFVRLILDWVQVFSRDWRPRGALLVLAEVTYTITDPPLRALRKVIPALPLGGIRLDLSFLVLMLACSFLLTFLAVLGA